MGAEAVTVTYDALDRLSVLTGTQGATYAYAGSGEIAALANTGSALNNRFVRGPNPDELLVSYSGTSGTLGPVWWINDPQGSPIAVAQADGTTGAIWTYDEYGQRGPTNGLRTGYTGQLWLPDFGVYHYKARAYHPGLGRFLQTDPIGYGDGLNLYGYVANDPVNRTDPTGKQSVSDLIIGTLHGLRATAQVQATGNSALAEVGVGAYVGRGPEGDLRVGVNLTSGPQVGNDISANAGVTVYAGDTSNVRGYATEASAGTTVGGVTAGYTTSRFDQAGPDSSSVPFAGVAVGPSLAPVSGHVSKQVTVANDMRVPMSPGAQVVSATLSTGRAVVGSWVDNLFGRRERE